MVLVNDTISLSRDTTEFNTLYQIDFLCTLFLNNILIYSAFHHSSSESSCYFQNVSVHYFSKWKKPNKLVKVV